MRRRFFMLGLPAALAACSEASWAPDAEVAQARYRHAAPPSITLFTVISNSNGSGGHSALMINASERVIFDPAGTWFHPQAPERNDVHFGITDPAVAFYKDYHARETWHVVTLDKPVPAEVAERALALVKDYGAVPKAFCTQANSRVLRQLPGFEGAPSTFFPTALMAYFERLPGVTRDVLYDDSPANNGLIAVPPLR